MKYLILGAGVSGLTFANKLLLEGESSFIVLEKETCAGGLCRSTEVDGAPFDIGGGHFLDVKRVDVNSFLFQFMPESEWNLYERDSRIEVCGKVINHPIEANIWQMSIEDQVDYLKSIAIAGCNLGVDMPQKFTEWIYWKLGKKIAEDYMIPYNQKMFGNEIDQLGTYWLEKLPNVSFEETLLSCLTRKPYGKQPGHAHFFYPKRYGYGELWLRMADAIQRNIEYGKIVESIDYRTKTVKTTDGEKYHADVIIVTIPWGEFNELVGMPMELVGSIKELKHTSIQTKYYSQNLDTDAHWIYCPARELSYHRILVRHNFCSGSNGYWTETNGNRVEINKNNVPEGMSFFNEYAYPLNTINKPQIINKLLQWNKGQGVYGLGRWGEHQHYNSDVCVERAVDMANFLLHL